MAKINWKSNNNSLEEQINSKAKHLDDECKARIKQGFMCVVDGKVCHFAYDLEDQINFQDVSMLFQNGTIETVMWSVVIKSDKTRIELSKTDFYRIYGTGVKFKLDVISQFKDVLMPKLKKASDVDTIDSVTW